MKVYLAGPTTSQSPKHIVNVCPANDPEGTNGATCPNEWFSLDPISGVKVPRQIQVVFVHGLAEVPTNLGRYLIQNNLAQQTRLILPPGGILA